MPLAKKHQAALQPDVYTLHMPRATPFAETLCSGNFGVPTAKVRSDLPTAADCTYLQVKIWQQRSEEER